MSEEQKQKDALKLRVMEQQKQEVDPALVERRLMGLILRDLMLEAYQRAVSKQSKDQYNYE